jgi:hypothetical protein
MCDSSTLIIEISRLDAAFGQELVQLVRYRYPQSAASSSFVRCCELGMMVLTCGNVVQSKYF